jgi:copper(I)-binding protein
MRMRKLADGLDIPAGGTVELKPGGMHLMLLDLKQPLVEGTRVPVKLTFKSGAVGEVELLVQALGAKNGGGGDHEHQH